MKLKTIFFLSILLVSLLTILLPFSLLQVPEVKAQVKGEETFPIQGTTVATLPKVNWTQFWSEFKKHSAWTLQWYNETSSSWLKVKEALTVQLDYPLEYKCKITLIFDAPYAGDYRLVFGIDYRVREYVERLDKYQYKLSYEGFEVIFDWSDVMSISGLIINHGIKEVKGTDVFWFSMRKNSVAKGVHFEIDPSIVSTSEDQTATCYTYQRMTFYANDRFWAFYGDGTNMTYCTSTDGASWSDETDVRTASGGGRFSIWFDGTYMHYVYSKDSPLYYRRGIPNSDGSITWSADEQTVSTTYSDTTRATISVDTNGYVWIGYTDHSSPYYYAYVIKSGNNDGTWGTTPGGVSTSTCQSSHSLRFCRSSYRRKNACTLSSGRINSQS